MANLSYTPANSSSGFQTAVWTMKLVFLLTGAVSTAIAFKAAVISTLPGLWVFITSLLFPPYIYIVFNFIVVITVAASTTFNHRRHHQPQPPQVVVPDGLQPPTRSLSRSPTRLQSSESLSLSDDDVLQEVAAGGDQKPIEYSSGSPEIRSCSSRRTDDGGEEEEAMAMQQGDTMEDVWRAIMEKKKPGRQLKKCDTWDTPPSVAVADEDEVHSEAAPSRRSGVKEKSMRKWETLKFNGGNGVQASPRPGMGRVRREVSPSPDDFKQRVEAFIAKVKLQR